MMRQLQRLMVALFAVLSVAEAFAVDYEYVPLVREGVKWKCDYSKSINYNIPELHPFTLEIKGDTVINGKSYKPWHYYSGDAIDPAHDTVPVYVREENKVVYGCPGNYYVECPFSSVDMLMSDSIKDEYVIYDFNNPEKYYDFLSDNYDLHYINTDTVEIGGKLRKRLVFDTHYNCDYYLIEGIGFCGYYKYTLMFFTPYYPYSDEYRYSFDYLYENGERVYINHNDYTMTLDLVREGVKWVNERVTVCNGDTSSIYYTYEFNGNDPAASNFDNRYYDFKKCYYYTGDDLDTERDSVIASLSNKGIYTCFYRNDPYSALSAKSLNLMNYETDVHYADLTRFYKFSHSDLISNEDNYTINFYKECQRWDFLNDENFVKIEDIVIDDHLCERFAYLGSDGDTLAYVVQGIGFDSRDMGDLLTPFTRRPDTTNGCYEYCGLSHVIEGGKIIYKGMRYRSDGPRSAVTEVTSDGDRWSDDPRFYNLMGQPVENPTQGIYIHRGKKIIVK